MKSFTTSQCPVSKAQKFICVFQTHENLNWKEHDVKKDFFYIIYFSVNSVHLDRKKQQKKRNGNFELKEAKLKEKAKAKGNRIKIKVYFRVSFNWQFIQDVVRHFIENLWWTRKKKKQFQNVQLIQMQA